MGRYLLVVSSDAVAGQEDEYNSWYDGQHIPDVVAVPGVTSGRRFEIDPASPVKPEAKYLAIYEFEAENPADLLVEFGKRAKAGQMYVSPSLDTNTAKPMIYKVR
jgi:hypothetical protein